MDIYSWLSFKLFGFKFLSNPEKGEADRHLSKGLNSGFRVDGPKILQERREWSSIVDNEGFELLDGRLEGSFAPKIRNKGDFLFRILPSENKAVRIWRLVVVVHLQSRLKLSGSLLMADQLGRASFFFSWSRGSGSVALLISALHFRGSTNFFREVFGSYLHIAEPLSVLTSFHGNLRWLKRPCLRAKSARQFWSFAWF